MKLSVLDEQILDALLGGAKTAREIGAMIGEQPHVVRPRLVRLEKHDQVSRIQFDRYSQILWRKP